MANYTNTKFFSKDTIYAYSEPNNNAVEGKEISDNGRSIEYVYGIDENGNKFKLAKILYDGDQKQNVYKISDKTPEIHADYWSRLAPKSILAGAGIIKLFKDEVRKAKDNPAAIQKPDTYATYYFIKPAIQTATTVNSAIIATANNITSGLNQIKNKISYSLTSSANSKALVFDFSVPPPAGATTVEELIRKTRLSSDTAQAKILEEPIYSAALILQSEPETIIEPNKEINLSAQFKNTGTAVWQRDKIYLNVYLKNDVANQFYHSSWLTPIRPAKLTEPQVNSGSFGNFNFLIKSPPIAGDYFFKVRPVWQDDTGNFNWLGDGVASWKIKVTRGEEPMTEPKNISTENIADALQEKKQPTEIKNAEQEKQTRDNDTAKKENDTANKEVEIAKDNARAEGEAKDQRAKDTEKENQKEASGATEENQGNADNLQNPDSVSVSTTNGQPAPRRRWRDIYPPETSIIINPSLLTNQNTAVFKFSSSEDDPNFYCRLDNESFVLCKENTVYENLADGEYKLEVIADDRFGNKDETPAEFSWTIDTIAPAKITDFAAVAGDTRGKIKLSWTKPEENVSYEIRYAEGKKIIETGAAGSQINWQDAGQISEAVDNNAEQIEVGSATALSSGQTYYFAIKSKDELNNVSEISNSPSSAANAEVNHIVISEIAVGINNASNEFIEIYNPTDSSVSLTVQIGLKIKLVDSSGNATEKEITWTNNTINSHGYFLIGHGSLGSVNIDATYGGELLTGVSGVILLDKDNQVIDKVGWGEKPPREKLAPIIASESQGIEIDQIGGLKTGQSIERKANYSSTAESMSAGADKYLGNGWDSDNNSADFVLRTISDPQNSLSPIEPIYAPKKINDFSVVAVAGNSRTIELIWTAPYGNFGNPEKLFYDIRYSTDEITAQNFSFTSLAPLIPAVVVAGDSQELTIENLSLGQIYYFAIKTKDNTGLESEISFTSYAFPSPVFLQNLVMTYFALSTNYGSDGYWPQVSQTIGNGFSQTPAKASINIHCNSLFPCDVSYKTLIVSIYSDANYTKQVAGSFLLTGYFGDPMYQIILAGSSEDVIFKFPKLPDTFIFNPLYYYKITFQFNILGSTIQWGGSIQDSYPNGESIDYIDNLNGHDLYFKLSVE